MIVTSAIAFIYGIIAINNCGSSTDIYKYLKKRIEYLEQYKNSSDSNINYEDIGSPRKIFFNNSEELNEFASKLSLDSESKASIERLIPDDLNHHSYGKIKRLKGIEYGFGVILIIFSLIFIGVAVLFMIYVCGKNEYKVLPIKMYTIFNIIKIVSIILSSIFIFLSVLYIVLLILANSEYSDLKISKKDFKTGITINISYGIYCFLYYTVLACVFCVERQKFIFVGSEKQPGADAKYDVKGNPIPRQVIMVTMMSQ